MARFFQYQNVARPPEQTSIGWFESLSEPIRQRIVPQLAIALIASGLFSTPVVPDVPTFTQSVSGDATFIKKIVYQSKAETTLVSEEITVDKWFVSFAEPVHKRTLPVALIQDRAIINNIVEDITVDKWFEPLAEPFKHKTAEEAQQASVPFIEAAEVVTVDKWFEPFSGPVRSKSLAAAHQQDRAWVFLPVGTGIYTKVVAGDVTFQRKIIYQSAAWTPQTIAAETITEDKWHQPWSEPVRSKIGLAVTEQQDLVWSTLTPAAEVVAIDRWLEPLSERIRGKIFGPELRPAFADVNGVSVNAPIFVIGSNVIISGSIIYQASAEPVTVPSAETITEDKWHYPWSEPIRAKRGIPATEQADLIWSSFTPPAETITEDKWHQAWSEPVRFRHLSVAKQQAHFAPEATLPRQQDILITPISGDVEYAKRIIYQSITWTPQTISAPTTSIDQWLTPLSEPLRPKSFVALQQPLIQGGLPLYGGAGVVESQPTKLTRFQYQKMTEPIVAPVVESVFEDKWHFSWSEPVRVKRGLAETEQQSLVWSTFTPAPEIITEDKWHYPWSEPVRLRQLATAQRVAHFAPEATLPRQENTVVQSVSGDVIFTRKIIFQSLAWCPQTIVPSVVIFGWLEPLTEPVRLQKWFGVHQQIALIQGGLPLYGGAGVVESLPVSFTRFQYPRIVAPVLPPAAAGVLVTIDATETNGDVAEFYAVVYNRPVKAIVSFKEIPRITDAYLSFEET